MSLAVRAELRDLAVLSGVIAEAFFDLPPSRRLAADPDERREMFPAYFGLCLGHAFAHGVVWATADRAAAALWLPAGAEPVPQPADYGRRLAVITGSPRTCRRAGVVYALRSAWRSQRPQGLGRDRLGGISARTSRAASAVIEHEGRGRTNDDDAERSGSHR